MSIAKPGKPPGPPPAGEERPSPDTDADASARLTAFDRALLAVLGWLLILIGVAGLVLPLLQGVLFMVIGAAILSLVNRTAFRLTRRAFRRWPTGWQLLLSWRRWIFAKLTTAGGVGHPRLHRALLVLLVLCVLAIPLVALPLACGNEPGDQRSAPRQETRPSADKPAATVVVDS